MIQESQDSGSPSLSSEEQELSEANIYMSDLRRQARRFYFYQNLLQYIIIGGAAFVAVLIGLPEVPKWIPALLSGSVAFATGIASYCRFGERSRVFLQDCLAVERESRLFKRKRGAYKGLNGEAALDLFREQVDNVKEAHSRQMLATLPSEKKSSE